MYRVIQIDLYFILENHRYDKILKEAIIWLSRYLTQILSLSQCGHSTKLGQMAKGNL